MNEEPKNMEQNQNECDPSGDCCVGRREFIQLGGLSAAVLAANTASAQVKPNLKDPVFRKLSKRIAKTSWPVLKRYPQSHVDKIAMPIGGIGTGTVSLGGRGDLRDWEIMNRPAKGFVPARSEVSPFFALFAKTADGKTVTRVLEGRINESHFEGSHGSTVPNENMPRFKECAFAAAYPFGQVALSDPDVPLNVTVQGFNPLLPCDAENSGLPIAVLRYVVGNPTSKPVSASICGTLPNFIGMDGWEKVRDWKGDLYPVGAKKNINEWRNGQSLSGIFMRSDGVDPQAQQYGTMALSTFSNESISHRLDWVDKRWGVNFLDFWDDYSVDGTLEERDLSGSDIPIGSLAVSATIPAKGEKVFTFFLTWHFPNRMTWTPRGGGHADDDCIGNYYTTKYKDAWDAAVQIVPRLPELEDQTKVFVSTFLSTDLPEEVKEAALFNVSTLRTQTCFRTPDGRFFGFEGCCNEKGCCWGSCTHVWNYEQATAFLFGGLARTMREVEFAYASDDRGMMSFRVELPLPRAKGFGKAAADGQMGCLMKLYRDWQLSGDEDMLRKLWPHAKRALQFCWIEGGWDADRDGVMEGCQHNTMDVEYYGPNPQMGIWYLGALHAAELMARHVGENDFADRCHRLYRQGSEWIDRNLFNEEYYIHEIRPPKDKSDIADSLLIGMGAKDPTKPEYQLGEGCLVDQLVGQFMAHVCGMGYLLEPGHVKTTLQSIMKYNGRESMHDHFNSMRSFAMGDEAALLMASYPKTRPETPFSYFTEVMTGFEYTAAVGMLYEGLMDDGLKCIENIRDRYDGQRRNPFNEAECGHHYARAMASWAAVLALTGFHYSAVDQSMSFADKTGTHFWSTGDAWGTCRIRKRGKSRKVGLRVMKGSIALKEFQVGDLEPHRFDSRTKIQEGGEVSLTIS